MSTNTTQFVHDDEFVMDVDMNIVEHLGISMYAKLPPVIAELIANAYDADAEEVDIILNDDPIREIIVRDKGGTGMSYEDLKQKYLIVGRKKRVHESDITVKGRKPIGKKGLGKLSVFGVADEVIVSSVKDGFRTSFTMELDRIRTSGNKKYSPDLLEIKSPTSDPNGTTISLKQLRRKSPFSPDEIANDLSNRFLIFDTDFRVKIVHNNALVLELNNQMKFQNIEEEFIWEFPLAEVDIPYKYANRITGEIISATKPVPTHMRGVFLLSRGKLVNKPEFYGVRESDYAHAYLSGWLNVDFIDDWDKDIISTNRESLNWEDPDAGDLLSYLQGILINIARERKNKVEQKKEELISAILEFDKDKWLDTLGSEKRLAKKMIDAVIQDSALEPDKAKELIGYVKDNFEFESFKEFAREMSITSELQTSSILKLLNDWELIEAKEFHKLAIGRIETINKFERYIEENAREVPILHNFLKRFPWLLDPRIMHFDDEVYYSDLLKHNFIEDVSLESDRRLDFLCVDFADNFFIIELKRPQDRISDKQLDQGLDYCSFIQEHLGNEHPRQNITTYIICGGIVSTPRVRAKAESYRNSNKVIVKTYSELLTAARKYHLEFIEKHKNLITARTSNA